MRGVLIRQTQTIPAQSNDVRYMEACSITGTDICPDLLPPCFSASSAITVEHIRPSRPHLLEGLLLKHDDTFEGDNRLKQMIIFCVVFLSQTSSREAFVLRIQSGIYRPRVEFRNDHVRSRSCSITLSIVIQRGHSLKPFVGVVNLGQSDTHHFLARTVVLPSRFVSDAHLVHAHPAQGNPQAANKTTRKTLSQ